jgi:hypothetical protein
MRNRMPPEMPAESAPIPDELREFCIGYLSTLNLEDGPAIISVEFTDEFAVVWYTSMRYWRTREDEDAPTGNVPLVVDLVNHHVYLRGHFFRPLQECFEMIRRNDPKVTRLL